LAEPLVAVVGVLNQLRIDVCLLDHLPLVAFSYLHHSGSPSTFLIQDFFVSSACSLPKSTVLLATMSITWTAFLCPILCSRSSACALSAGLQSRSRKTTTLDE